jgi:RHS repeat-associated protein
MTYHVNDMIRSVRQGGTTTTYTLDVNADRIRSWTVDAAGSSTTKTHHYSDDGDTPVWTDEGDGTDTQVMVSVTTVAGLATGPVAGEINWMITDLHGNNVMTVVGASMGPAATHETDEFGVPRTQEHDRYDWLGTDLRAHDENTGLAVMGVRMYNPTTGRFLQVDPIDGGSCSAYDYACGDPVNGLDTTGNAAYGGGGGGGAFTCPFFSCKKWRDIGDFFDEVGYYIGYCWLAWCTAAGLGVAIMQAGAYILGKAYSAAVEALVGFGLGAAFGALGNAAGKTIIKKILRSSWGQKMMYVARHYVPKIKNWLPRKFASIIDHTVSALINGMINYATG